MSAVYFLSDLHLGHKNICKFRPGFTSVEEHNALIKENYHKRVTKRDTVYFLGDVAFDAESLADVKTWAGAKKILIAGNHCLDHFSMKDLVEAYDEVYSLKKYKEFWLSHAPIHPDELRGKINIHGHCVDSETEILTEQGWKKYDEIVMGEALPTINPQGLWEVDTVEGYTFKKDYQGCAYEFKGKGIDMLVSDEHRVYFLKKDGSPAYLPANRAFKRSGLTIVKAALPSMTQESSLSLNTIRLYVWMVADGFVTPADLFRIRVQKERKIVRVEFLLKSLNISYTKNVQKDGSVCFNFKRPLDLQGWNIKGLDRKILDFSKEQVVAFREEYRNTDGNRNLIFTSKKCEVDLLQELFVKNGFATKVHERVGHGFSKSVAYQLSVTENLTQGLIRVSERVKEIEYTGIMWCVTTRNGNFIARRGGSVFVTGNCHYHNIDDARYVNVSMEQINYTPIELHEIRRKIYESTN